MRCVFLRYKERGMCASLPEKLSAAAAATAPVSLLLLMLDLLDLLVLLVLLRVPASDLACGARFIGGGGGGCAGS
jgi:hypothetical protein